MFENLLSRLQRLNQKRVEVKATGNYPNKRQTKVADVAVYQNNGTETISAARFVEKAAQINGHWRHETGKAVSAFVEGDFSSLQLLGNEMADDIGIACNRIKTGQLKASFDAEVK